jgi:NDP-sugar pyrophosphorylase family protein
VEPGIFDWINSNTPMPISLELDLIPETIKRGSRIFGNIDNGFFIDIGIPEDYYAAGDYFLTNKISRA